MVCFGDNSAGKFLKTLTLYIFSALLNLNPIERNSFASHNAIVLSSSSDFDNLMLPDWTTGKDRIADGKECA